MAHPGVAPSRPTGAELDAAAQENLRSLRLGGAVFAGLLVVGTVGYLLLEDDWTVGEALYMVVITLSTVGFREVRELSPAGRHLTIVLIVTGVVTFGYIATSFSRLVVEGELRRVLGRRRMEREIARLDGHYIVCGYGRVGREVTKDLLAEGHKVVVIDVDEEALASLADTELPYVRGNAADENVLLEAGIERARGLLLTLSHEADNVYVTLIAKELRSDIIVLARSISEQGDRRLFAAGADRVVSPERIGAQRMAQAVMRPTVVEFTDIVTARENLELQLDERRIAEGSELVDRTIQDCEIRRRFGLIVVGVLNPEGDMVFNPPPDHRIRADSTLILLGRREDLSSFGEVAGA